MAKSKKRRDQLTHELEFIYNKKMKMFTVRKKSSAKKDPTWKGFDLFEPSSIIAIRTVDDLSVTIVTLGGAVHYESEYIKFVPDDLFDAYMASRA